MTNYCGSHWQQRSNTTPTKKGYAKSKSSHSSESSEPVKTHLSMAMEVDDEEDDSPYRIKSKKVLMSKHRKK